MQYAHTSGHFASILPLVSPPFCTNATVECRMVGHPQYPRHQTHVYSHSPALFLPIPLLFFFPFLCSFSSHSPALFLPIPLLFFFPFPCSFFRVFRVFRGLFSLPLPWTLFPPPSVDSFPSPFRGLRLILFAQQFLFGQRVTIKEDLHQGGQKHQRTKETREKSDHCDFSDAANSAMVCKKH